MLTATNGIVFKHYKYSENSIICKIYTEAFGIKSYLIKGVNGKSKKFKPALFQPLTILDLVVLDKENRNLQFVKEIQCAEQLNSIPFNIYKSSVALFIAEILLKSIKEEEPNAALYGYVKHFIQLLDKTEKNYSNFHLLFLLHLTQYLGFFPKKRNVENLFFFDMREGRFVADKPLHSNYMDKVLSTHFHDLFNMDYNNCDKLCLNGQIRAQLLEKLVVYYAIHLEGMGKINALEVLKMVYTD
ncbi:MAG: DNA repair protein RecO [Bacteroidales bacterium]|nr:DNA repair protein RecO [Bacteroidales bacterium]